MIHSCALPRTNFSFLEDGKMLPTEVGCECIDRKNKWQMVHVADIKSLIGVITDSNS